MEQIALEYLLKKYGLRVSVDQVCEELQMKKQTLICNRSAGRFTLPLFREGRRLFCNSLEFARYIASK